MTTLQTPENALEQALVFLRRGNTEAAIGFATVAVQLLSSYEKNQTMVFVDLDAALSAIGRLKQTFKEIEESVDELDASLDAHHQNINRVLVG